MSLFHLLTLLHQIVKRNIATFKNCSNDCMCCPCVLCTCSIGGPVGNYLFVWPLPAHVTLEAALSKNQRVISQIQSDVPVYHRRELRRRLISKFGRISPKTNVASLRKFY